MRTIKLTKEALLAMAPGFARKVTPLYKTLKWTWHDNEIPSLKQIQSTLSDLINDLHVKNQTIQTGGLTAGIDEYGDGFLRFEVEQFE
jgi:hypothetical protein